MVTANLEYYKVFYYAARSGSVTKAAEMLNISQPAASQSLKQLENLLGVELFHRVSKGIRLTSAGEILYADISKGYELIEGGEEKIRRLKNLELGEVRIGASDMTLQYYLLPYLERFHERYPAIKVNVTNAPTPETLDILEAGKIDFGVVSSPFENGEDLDVREVREIEDIFIAGRRFTSCKNKTLDLQALKNLPMIFLEGNTSTRTYMDGFLRRNGVDLRPEFELATSDMIVQFVLRNLGVGCVVRDFAKEALESGQIFELRFNKLIPKRRICLVRSKKLPLSAAAEKLLKIMEPGGQEGTGAKGEKNDPEYYL